MPVEVGAAIDWAQVQSTSATTCGVDVLGKAYCWGADFFGQLGDGTPNNNVAGATKVPTQVGVATDWAEVRPGWSHTCGRKTTGSAWCWGADTNGQLGDGTASTTQTVVPTQVGGAADWTQLAANDNSTCGVRAGGHAWCWGLNLAGVLGDILSMTADVTCDSDSQCKSVGLGDKPCGGFQEYRVYSLKSVDEPALLRKIDDYNRLDKEINLKNNKVSTCEFLMQPATSCVDNQCMAAPAHTPPLLK